MDFLANKGGTTVSRPFMGVGPFCIRFAGGLGPDIIIDLRRMSL